MSENRFELAVWDREQDTILSCRDYLNRRGKDISWSPAASDSAINLSVAGEEWLGDEWNFGDLQLIVTELEDVFARLQRDEVAILRSAVLSQPQVPYLLFEPASGDVIKISMFFLADTDLGAHFPIKYWSNQDPQKLFAHVIENRSTLLSDSAAGRRPKELPFPRPELLNALTDQIALGQEVVKLQDRSHLI